MWYIIVNPAAAGGKAKRDWPAIERALQEMGFAYTVQFTAHRGHAIRLVDDAVLKGYRNILGVGGDGTNHEIVNGIMQQPHAPATDITYALLPVGTGNDWARMYGIPHNIRARLRRLQEGQTVVQDVGLATYHSPEGQEERRYFVNVAGMAYDGFVGQQLALRPSKPSKLVYMLSVLRYLFDYQLVPANVHFDGTTVNDHFYTINIGICRYSGGGMQFVPHAIPDDGLLALTIAHKVSKWTVIGQMPHLYVGTLLRHPKISSHQTRHIRVEHPEGGTPTLLEADGEFLGQTPAVFTILEKALKIGL